MSGVEWRRDPSGTGPRRRYIGRAASGMELRLTHTPNGGGGWTVWPEFTDIYVALPRGDLPDAEAQRLAVPTLVAALKAVVERLEAAA